MHATYTPSTKAPITDPMLVSATYGYYYSIDNSILLMTPHTLK